MGEPLEDMVVSCPKRFEQNHVVFKWLIDIVGFDLDKVQIAREVPFMTNTQTGRPAGKIDFVIAQSRRGRLEWHGLEIQAVYFSGHGMEDEFLCLNNDDHAKPPFPQHVRRPDWRSSSAKRLMPQLRIKSPTLRRWGAKLAVCVDSRFFDAIGGPSETHTQDLDSGDIIWMTPEIRTGGDNAYGLHRGHWEVLTLEKSEHKLESARMLARSEFEDALKNKLEPFSTHLDR